MQLKDRPLHSDSNLNQRKPRTYRRPELLNRNHVYARFLEIFRPRFQLVVVTQSVLLTAAGVLIAALEMNKIEEIFSCEGRDVDEFLNIAKTLREMPVVDLETPTLCLVGAPNVGKSSLVRPLSTGKLEVCNYPF